MGFLLKILGFKSYKMSKNKADQGPEKRKTLFKPMFDLFAINPSFYLLGHSKTVSWLGCIASGVLVGLVGAIVVLYNVSYLRKSNFSISSILQAAEITPVIDLKEKQFFLAFRGYYPSDGLYFGLEDKFFSFSYSRIKQDQIGRAHV